MITLLNKKSNPLVQDISKDKTINQEILIILNK